MEYLIWLEIILALSLFPFFWVIWSNQRSIARSLESVTKTQAQFSPLIDKISEQLTEVWQSREAMQRINADHEDQIQRLDDIWREIGLIRGD